MGKKYLLYIHDPLFEKEKEKSKLVNNLLERHYHDTVEGGKTQEDVHREINKAVGWNVIDLGDDKQQGGQLKEVLTAYENPTKSKEIG